MSLIVDKSQPIGVMFIKWLVRKIGSLVILNIDTRKISRLQRYLDENFPDIHVNLLAALKYSVKYIKFKDYGRYYKIYLDVHNKLYMGEPLEDIIKFIDNGNLDIDGCQIFSRAFSRVEQELPELLKEYSYTGGRI